MKIVVIGGSGLIGRKLVDRLRHRGHAAIAASPASGVDTMLFEPSAYRPSQRRRRVSARRDSCNWACTFHPFVHGTTHVGAVSPRKADQVHDEATGGKAALSACHFSGL
jgi:uncharacterized protein YbjT (DUF2867 family)